MLRTRGGAGGRDDWHQQQQQLHRHRGGRSSSHPGSGGKSRTMSVIICCVISVVVMMVCVQLYFVMGAVLHQSSASSSPLPPTSSSSLYTTLFTRVAELISRPLRALRGDKDMHSPQQQPQQPTPTLMANPVNRLIRAHHHVRRPLRSAHPTPTPTAATITSNNLLPFAQQLAASSDDNVIVVPKDVTLALRGNNGAAKITIDTPASSSSSNSNNNNNNSKDKNDDPKCAVQFGDSGFKVEARFCTPVTDTSRSSTTCDCRWNDLLKSSVCTFANLQLDATLVAVSPGGEPITSVLGRAEDAEFPRLSKGAFKLQCADELPGLHVTEHMTRMDSGLVVSTAPLECDVWIEEPTLMVTRNEYANLYHTMAEWYGAYQTAQLHRLSPATTRVLFMDGHAQGALDTPWLKLFQPLREAQATGDSLPFVKQLGTRRTCFRHAIWVPGGYESPLFVNQWHPWSLSGCRRPPDVHAFAQRMLAAYQLQYSYTVPVASLNVLVVLRKGYLSHPRVGGRAKAPERVLDNAGDMLDVLRRCSIPRVRLVIIAVHFEEMTFVEQLQHVVDADILIGMHGAGLSHSLLMKRGAVLMELVPPNYSDRQHFVYFAAWNDLFYAPFAHLTVAPASDRYKLDTTAFENALRTTVLPEAVKRKQQQQQQQQQQ